GKVSEFAKHGKIVHIDIDPSEINKNKVAHIPIVSDVRHALDDLLRLLDEEPPPSPPTPLPRGERGEERLPSPLGGEGSGVRGLRHADWIRQIEHWRETEPLRFADRDDAVLPQYAIQRLWQILKERNRLDETVVTTGVGQHQMWAAQYFHFNRPRHWITSGGARPVGFRFRGGHRGPAARPGRTVLAPVSGGRVVVKL